MSKSTAKGSLKASSGRRFYGSGRPVCGRKFCKACGRWRHVCDFYAEKRSISGGVVQLSSECKTCLRIRQREHYAQPEAREQRREYGRIWTASKRREAGVPERKWTKDAKRGPDAQQVASTIVDPAAAVAFIEAEAKRRRIDVQEAVGGEHNFRAFSAWKNEGRMASLQVVDAILLNLTGDPTKLHELYPPQAA